MTSPLASRVKKDMFGMFSDRNPHSYKEIIKELTVFTKLDIIRALETLEEKKIIKHHSACTYVLNANYLRDCKDKDYIASLKF